MATVTAEVVQTPEAVVETLRAFHAEGVELIAVAGGDGTLQAALTGLLRDLALPAETLPKLLVIGGGTTNMSAADLGTRCQPPVALTRLAAWLERRGPEPHCCSRPLVRLALGRPRSRPASCARGRVARGGRGDEAAGRPL